MADVVNTVIGSKGIPLPFTNQIQFKDFTQKILDGFISIGATPTFHFTMEPENEEIEETKETEETEETEEVEEIEEIEEIDEIEEI